MGYELVRFIGEVDEELICSICSGVFEEPLQAPTCEHAFCKACINEWISRQPTCPVDRLPITAAQLRPAPRLLRKLLSRLVISCDNASYGCTTAVKLDSYATHLTECEHNPKRPVQCEQGCGSVIPMDELKDHNCVNELRSIVHKQQQKMVNMETEMSETRFQMTEIKRQLTVLQDLMRAMKVSNPGVRVIAENMERDDVSRWSNSLSRARVTRWGGMISTPDVLLQAMIKRSLAESGCPGHILDELMHNSHERNWPQGLSSLETRQNNRRQYENYVCKRIPSKQAVVVLLCDNQHLPEDMISAPGLVMIFAHGIE
uniref:E3 ubiquitin-protein ligase NRDP1 n=1 Tax=Cacopsylla melanoneura TaxID=428564 RepID=A0A8D9EG61_9HEMI